MQHDSFSYTIDPSCLDLKARPFAPTHYAESSLAVDDVAIASGQADFDYGGNNYLDTWSNPHCNELPIDDFGLDDLEFEYALYRTFKVTIKYILTKKHSSTQATEARSAPTEVWSVGGGGANSDSSSQYAGSSPIGDGEPWNCLQTFASGASSAPGLNYRDSRIHQNGSPSFPSKFLEPDFSFGSSRGSHRHRQASPLQQRMLHDLQFAQHTAINDCYGDPQPTTRRYLDTPQSNRFGRDYTDGENDDWDEAEGSCGLHISSFPSSLPDDHAMPSLTSSTTEPRPISHPRRNWSPGKVYLGNGSEYTSDSFDQSIGQGLTGESRQKLQSEDLDFLTANEPTWQQQQELSLVAGEILGSANAGCEPSGQGLKTNYQDSTPNHLDRAALQCDAHDATSEKVPDYPGAIKIPGSSKRYDADLASSFPPTAGHFPDYMPIVQTSEQQQSTLSTSQPIMTFSKHASLSMRRKPSKTKPSRRSRSGSLKVIQEHDSSLGTSPTGSLRGRRKGHLDQATAFAASQKRSNGTVCIRCKVLKQTASANMIIGPFLLR